MYKPLVLAVTALCATSTAGAAEAPKSGSGAATVRLYQGPAPGSVPARQTEVTESRNGLHIVRNVTVPTLEPYLPPTLKATGVAVVIAPGGAFMMLAYDSEGTLVAKWLADHGVAAFVLKYRLEATPADSTAFLNQLRARMGKAASASGPPGKSPDEELAAADGMEAVRLVRRHAREWNIEANRVGFLGFSSGAITAGAVATAPDAAARPDFVGIIYGASHKDRPLRDAPPAFFATAADDPLVGRLAYPMYAAWRAAGRSAELHLYERGGHGFGLVAGGYSSDHWLDEFYWWLQSIGLVKSKPSS